MIVREMRPEDVGACTVLGMQLHQEGYFSDLDFDENKMFTVMAPSAYQIADAERSGTFQGGDFGGGGVWFLYGCEKS